jgi:macrolide transport system ATP-binding/permease protein
MQNFLYIDKLSFSYENSVEPLFDSLSFQLQQGWTGIVGPNGSGKTTLLKLLCEEIQDDFGSINFTGIRYYCEQRTDYIPSGFESLLNSYENQAIRLRKILNIQEDWTSRWDQLSHGERKRCQIATALFCNPDLLAIDEPSNHLDSSSRQILFDALKSYNGIGILVSHDRYLLDNLCNHTLFISNNNVELYKCNYSTAIREREQSYQAKLHNYETAKREIKKLKKKIGQQRAKAEQADKLKSKKAINRRDHDAKSKKDLARLSGKDAVAGQIYKRAQTQLDRSIQQKNAIQIDKSFELGIQFDAQKISRYFPVILTADRIDFGNGSHLTFPELVIQQGDKIGIIGDNGSGKSTFIRYLVDKLKIPLDKIIYIPQEITIEESRLMIKRIHDFDNVEKSQIMTIIRRLGSEPIHVLETSIPSPGEVRKLMLAEGIMQNPAMIIMDEPTNHMDLPSIECVESALKGCECTELLVSHDHKFLESIVHYYWNFKLNGNKEFAIRIKNINR